MIIYDFFAGTGSATKAFEDQGHKVIRVELDPYFDADERDILSLTADYLVNKYGRPDFVWASPPCTTFSVASIGRHWTPDKQPKSESAKKAIELVQYTVKLIEALNPVKGFLIENPRGMLRKQRLLAHLPRHTITYCQYGDFRMKPTDLWGEIDNWQPKQPCRNGDNCHQAAPRGSRFGTQGIKGAKDRSVIPYRLSEEICQCLA